MGIILGTLFFLIPIGILVFFIVIAFVFIKTKDQKNFKFDIRNIYVAYLKIVSLISIIIFATGLSLVAKSAMSYVFEQDFSYQQMQKFLPRDDSGSFEENIEEYYFEENIQSRDLITGISISFVGLLFFVIHQGFNIIIIKKSERSNYQFVNTIFIIIGLIIFTFISIFSLTIGIYNLIEYLLIDLSDNIWQNPTPGDPLSVAFVFLPFWIYFLARFTIKVRKNSN